MKIQKRVLCVQFAGDEKISQKFKEVLKQEGFTVVEVDRSAVWPQGSRIDLVIQLGLSEIELGGYAFLDYLKELYPKVPVIVFTGHQAPEVVTQIENRGASYCWRKASQLVFMDIIQEILKPRAAP